MNTPSMNRRKFLQAAAAGAAATPMLSYSRTGEQLSLFGGTPVRKRTTVDWPMKKPGDEELLLTAYRDGGWGRQFGEFVTRFESAWARMTGSAQCITTTSGTTALITSLHSVGVQPGDEVILSPYTFQATVTTILHLGALPVFADTDPATLQIDANTIEERITPRTRAIVPVHLGGGCPDMDRIMDIANAKGLAVVEDACQAWTSAWRGKNVGLVGDVGAFSFQNSKNITGGEGGAIIGRNNDAMDRCARFMFTGSHPYKRDLPKMMGLNFRMTEFQGAVLCAQMPRFREQQQLRFENARYLDTLLNDVPGLAPARRFPGQTNHGYHLYMMCFDNRHFAGISKRRFLEAMSAEGVGIGGGYRQLNKADWIEERLQCRSFRSIYGPKRLAAWRRNNHLPGNDTVCADVGMWMSQRTLLGPRSDMEKIAEAAAKVQRNAARLRT